MVVASYRPKARVSEAWFTDERTPNRRLHVSWHGTERLIVFSLWNDDRCTSSFRLPVREAGRMITAVADAMARALTTPTREPERVDSPEWRALPRRLHRTASSMLARWHAAQTPTPLRVIRIVEPLDGSAGEQTAARL